ncbi:hypothetical protein LX81_03997 [Palleronia aestuarii]|uniref:Integrase-like protein n=1 Tax=Palleronia aestuarii TaxID=568105 RepID=A0A2W7PPH5_9RHOB|nr:hypothetical protein LX81_03997 [Palleronia aestuarii]
MPKIRATIQASTEPAWMVAERYGISGQTIWKWRKRDSVHDRCHTSNRLQKTLTPAHEAVAVSLRRKLLLPLDDLLAVVCELLNPNVSRAGLDHCLWRDRVSRLEDLKPKTLKIPHKPFNAYGPGYLHVDVKYLLQMADEERRRYLFVAIDRVYRWVFVRIYSAKTAANARRFLRDLDRAAPMKITWVLTDNGKSSRIGCSACASAPRRATTNSTASAPSSGSSTVWPRPCAPKPMAWSRASTAGSRTSYKAIALAQAKIWNRRSCATSASTTASSRNPR